MIKQSDSSIGIWEEDLVYGDGFVVLTGREDSVAIEGRENPNPIEGVGRVTPYFGMLRASEDNPIGFSCIHPGIARIMPINAPSGMMPADVWANEELWKASNALLVPYRIRDSLRLGTASNQKFENPNGFRDNDGKTSPATVLLNYRWPADFGRFYTASHVADSQLASHLFHWLSQRHIVYSYQEFPKPSTLSGNIDLGYEYAKKVLPEMIGGLEERFKTRLRLSDY